jgi:hypothetical protein
VLIRNHRFIMPVAKGTFTFNLNTFAGEFNVEGNQVLVNGSLSQYVPFGLFVPVATVTYNNVDDFLGTYTIRASDLSPAYIGINKVDISFERAGTVLWVKGNLESPTSQKFIIHGSGDWHIPDY